MPKIFKNAFLVPKIKKICIPSARNETKSILQIQELKSLQMENNYR